MLSSFLQQRHVITAENFQIESAACMQKTHSSSMGLQTPKHAMVHDAASCVGAASVTCRVRLKV